MPMTRFFMHDIQVDNLTDVVTDEVLYNLTILPRNMVSGMRRSCRHGLVLVVALLTQRCHCH